MRGRGRAAVLIGTLWFAPFAAPAAAQETGGEISLETLLGMEVQSVFGASRFLQKTTEAPASVSIVTAEDIQRYGWRTLADVLRAVRGFYTTDDRSWGYAGVRGFQRPGDYNTRLLLLVDGRRANDSVYDQATIQEDLLVELGDVERIEIVRGPSASLYGNSAFFGVINVVTRPAGQPGRPTVTTDVGSQGLRIGRVSGGRRLGSGVTINASATLQDLDGVQALYFPEYDAPATNFGVSTGLDYTRRRNGRLTVAYGDVTVSSGYNSRTRGVPTGSYGVVFNDPGTWVRDERLFVDAAWQSRIGAAWTAMIRGGYDVYKYTGQYAYQPETPGAQSLLNTDVGTGRLASAEVQLSRRVTAAHHLTLGGERRQFLTYDLVNYDDPAAPIFRATPTVATSAVYVQDEWRLHPTLLVNAGARYDDFNRFDNRLTPRAAVIYQPRSQTALKFISGVAFRAPNAYEWSYEYPGQSQANPRLAPERIATTEAVLEQYLGRRVRLTGSVFEYRVDDLVDLGRTPDGLLTYENVGEARAVGVEGEVEARWPSGVAGRLSYAYTDAVNRRTGLRLTNSPAHITQALVSAPLLAGTFIGLEARALGRRQTYDGGWVGAHVVPNVTLSRPVARRGLGAAFTVSNLTNTPYADPVSPDFVQTAIPQNGRTARLRIWWAF